MSQKQDLSTHGSSGKGREIVLPFGAPLWTPSRREAIVAAGTVAAARVLGWPAKAQANPLGLLGFAGRAAFAAAVGWLVTRLLNRAFPQDPDELRVVHVPAPRLSGDEFHNRHAAPYAITDPRYHIHRTHSRPTALFVEVGEVLNCAADDATDNFADLNLAEMECSRQHFGGLLIPAGARRRPSDGERQTFATAAHQGRGADLEYVRLFLSPTQNVRAIPIQSQMSRSYRERSTTKVKFRRVFGYGTAERTTGRTRLTVAT